MHVFDNSSSVVGAGSTEQASCADSIEAAFYAVPCVEATCSGLVEVDADGFNSQSTRNRAAKARKAKRVPEPPSAKEPGMHDILARLQALEQRDSWYDASRAQDVDLAASLRALDERVQNLEQRHVAPGTSMELQIKELKEMVMPGRRMFADLWEQVGSHLAASTFYIFAAEVERHMVSMEMWTKELKELEMSGRRTITELWKAVGRISSKVPKSQNERFSGEGHQKICENCRGPLDGTCDHWCGFCWLEYLQSDDECELGERGHVQVAVGTMGALRAVSSTHFHLMRSARGMSASAWFL